MGRLARSSDKARRRSVARGLRVGGMVMVLALLVAVPVALALAPVSSTTYPWATTATTGWKDTTQTVPIMVVPSETTATATLHYSLDDGTTFTTMTSEASGTVTFQVPVTSEGSHLVRYFASDTGTSTVEATSTGPTYVNIDLTRPVTTAAPALAAASGASPWFDAAVQVTLTAVDAVSGVPTGGTTYRIDDGNLTVYGVPFTVNAQGSTKLTYRSFDRAGNVEATQTAWVNIDETDPSVTAESTPSRASGWYNSDVTVELTATDTVSGVAKTQYRVHGTTAWTDAVNDEFTLTVADDTGIFTYEYQAVDKAGNVSSAADIVVNIDKVKPQTYGQNVTGKAGKSIKVKYKIHDNLSPKAKDVYVKIKNSKGKVVKTQKFSDEKNVRTWYSFTWTTSTKGTYKYYVYAKDLAGNAQSTAGSGKITVK